METQVKAALAISDYQQVSKLLKQWQHSDDAENPLLRFYAAQLQEQTNRLAAAEKNYCLLLQQCTNRKIISQARAGIERIRQQQKEQQQAALAEARAIKGADEGAILAIAAPTTQNRDNAIHHFAEVFNLDVYTARMKVPNDGFRIYRVGQWGELSYFKEQLTAEKVPAFCVKVNSIQTLQTFQILYFETLSPQPTIICRNAERQLGKISLDWTEVPQQVRGQLPIFEQVIDLGARGRTVHKEKVQDYAQVVDLHLPGREIVVRLCDRLYQYQKGVSLGAVNEINSRIRWNHLLANINQATSGLQSNDFARFGKGALEFINLLPAIAPSLDIDRRAPSDWDLAFHLYSSLCYYKSPELS
ncbi:MAG: hypothetical protein ACFB16_15825 [Phormidesmis sp.]